MKAGIAGTLAEKIVALVLIIAELMVFVVDRAASLQREVAMAK